MMRARAKTKAKRARTHRKQKLPQTPWLIGSQERPLRNPGVDVLPEDTVGAIIQRIEDVDEQQRLFQSQQVATLAQMMKQQNEMMKMLSELRAAVPAGGKDVSTPKGGKDADDEKGGKKGKKKQKVKKGK